jgi:hypothetical protein
MLSDIIHFFSAHSSGSQVIPEETQGMQAFLFSSVVL